MWSAGPRLTLPSDVKWSWALAPAPITQLLGVSCFTRTNCLAVGTYLTSSGYEPLLALESKGVWQHAVRLVLPADAALTNQVAALFAVDCTSDLTCAVVGTYTDLSGNQMPFFLQEHNGLWGSPTKVALPTGSLNADQAAALTSISCTSLGNCIAVGNYVNGAGYQAVALTEKNAVWSTAAQAVTIPLPLDASTPGVAYLNGLNHVTCPSLTNCVGVGQYLTATGYKPFAVAYGAGTWSTAVAVTPPTLAAPVGSLAATLNDVSCTSTTTCEAVGSFGTNNQQLPFTTFFSGTAWSGGTAASMPTDGLVPLTGQLTSIHCFVPTACVLAGVYNTSSGFEGLVSTPTTAPDPPSALSTIRGNGRVSVQWSVPVYGGLLPVTRYVVTASPGGATCQTTTTSCVIVSLTNGIGYNFSAVAFNAVGGSVASNPSPTTTPATVAGAPLLKKVVARIGSLHVTLAAPLSNGGLPIQTYQYSLDGGFTWHPRASGTTGVVLDIFGLKRKHTYRLSLRAVNLVGPGAPAVVVKVTTL